MSLTNVEENQVKHLLVNYEGLYDLSTRASDIIASLAPEDVNVINLPTAAPLSASDVLYVAQANTDVKATMEQISNFILPLFPLPPSDSKLYFMGQF